MFHVPGNRHFGGCSQQLLKFTQASILRSRPSFLCRKNTCVLRLHSSGLQNPHNFPCIFRYASLDSSSPYHPPSHLLWGSGNVSLSTLCRDISTGIQPSPSFGSCTISTLAVVRNTMKHRSFARLFHFSCLWQRVLETDLRSLFTLNRPQVTQSKG